jgi:hypothetical protein
LTTSSGNEIFSKSDTYKETIFNPRWYMENMLYIVNKESKLVPFRLNEEQNVMMEHIEFCLENKIPIRIIVLKARQIGATTFFTALGFWLAAMNKNTSYGIVAHRLDSAESIFQKNKIFYNNLPQEMRPSTTQMSGEGITFNRKDGTGVNSKIKFATVNEGVFRGQTLNYLHLTECAFWEGNVGAIENSLAPTVSMYPNTIIVRESTANGYNFFKDDWDRAAKGISDYKPFFFGWQDHSEYTMDVPRGFVLTEKEKDIMERFELTLGQVAWRRYQITNNYSGNESLFQQENPMTPSEAFIASGTSVFPAETLVRGYEAACDPIRIMPLASYPAYEKLLIWEEPKVENEKIYAQKSQWSYEEQAYVYVDTDLLLEEIAYRTPYTVGIDTAGLGTNLNQVTVVNNVTKRMVARFGKKNVQEEALADIAIEIARMYNDALIAPEVNYSHEICNYIIKKGYKNIYITETLTRKDMEIVGGVEYGFKTTVRTKAPIISSLRAKLNEDPSLVPDKEFWEQAEYYILEDVNTNKMNAAAGHDDDIIMSLAIAEYVSDSRQAKQSKQVIKDKKTKDSEEHFIIRHAKKGKKKSTPLRKGVYRNHA